MWVLAVSCVLSSPWHHDNMSIYRRPHRKVKVNLPMSRTLCFAVCCRECQYFQYFSCSSRFLSSLKTTITTLCRGENHTSYFLFGVSVASQPPLPAVLQLYSFCLKTGLLKKCLGKENSTQKKESYITFFFFK